MATGTQAAPKTGAEARAARLNNKRGAGAVRAVPKPKDAAKGGKQGANATARTQEAEAKRLAAQAAKEKKEQEKKEREAAAEKRRKETAPRIDFKLDDYPVEDQMILVENLIGLPEMVGPNPDAAFVRNVQGNGVIDPVTLVRADENDTVLRLADGRRRVRAAQLSGRPEVPARIYSVGEKKKDEIAGAIAVAKNALRSDNFASDVQAVEYFRKRFPDMPLDRMAKEIGVPYGTLKKRARLLNLPKKLRDLLYGGQVKHSVIMELSGMTEDQINQALKIFKESGRLSLRDVDAIRHPGGKPSRNGASGGEGGDVDADALLDGGAANAPTIPDTGDLTTDLFSFLEAVAETSGIAFNLSDTGQVSFVRGGERIVFQAAAESAPAGGEGDEDEGGEDSE